MNPKTTKLPQLRPFAPSSAGKALGVDKKTIEKAVESGLLPDLQPTTIEAAAAIPLLAELTTEAGDYVQALRFGAPSRNAPAGEKMLMDGSLVPEDRTLSGYHVDMTPEEIEAAASRWWRASGKDSIDRDRFWICIRASFVVGLIELPESGDLRLYSELDDTGATRYQYVDAKLVAYRDPTGAPKLVAGMENARTAEIAMKVVGLRRLGGGGGTFTSTGPLY